jgi:hypothetical protein
VECDKFIEDPDGGSLLAPSPYFHCVHWRPMPAEDLLAHQHYLAQHQYDWLWTGLWGIGLLALCFLALALAVLMFAWLSGFIPTATQKGNGSRSGGSPFASGPRVISPDIAKKTRQEDAERFNAWQERYKQTERKERHAWLERTGYRRFIERAADRTRTKGRQLSKEEWHAELEQELAINPDAWQWLDGRRSGGGKPQEAERT